MRPFRILVATAATAALALAVLPPPVEAAPPPDVGTAIESRWQQRTLSKIQAKALDDVPTMIYMAADGNHMNVDYRKLDKYDRGNVTWRRDYAAGILWFGGTITHISAAERKRVRARIPKVDPPVTVTGARTAAPKPCEGRSGQEPFYDSKGKFRGRNFYLNSCDVQLLTNPKVYGAGVGGAALTVLGYAKKLGPMVGLLGALLSAQYAQISYAEGRSTIGAVRCELYYPSGAPEYMGVWQWAYGPQ